MVITDCIKALPLRQHVEREGLWVISNSSGEMNAQRENPVSSKSKRRNHLRNPGEKTDEDKDHKQNRKKVDWRGM